MKSLPTTVLFASLALFIPFSASAIGLSVSPPALSLKTAAGKEAAARFTVSNPSREVGLFEVYPEEFEQYLTIMPSRFVLEAGEKREVVVRALRREGGVLRTALAVEARPLGLPSLDIGGGVRLPLTVTVAQSSSLLAGGAQPSWRVSVAVLAILCIAAVAMAARKRALTP